MVADAPPRCEGDVKFCGKFNISKCFQVCCCTCCSKLKKREKRQDQMCIAMGVGDKTEKEEQRVEGAH